MAPSQQACSKGKEEGGGLPLITLCREALLDEAARVGGRSWEVHSPPAAAADHVTKSPPTPTLYSFPFTSPTVPRCGENNEEPPTLLICRGHMMM